MLVQHYCQCDLTPVQMASGFRPPASKNTTDTQNKSRCIDNEHRETPPTLENRHEAKVVVHRKHIQTSKSDSPSRPKSQRHGKNLETQRPSTSSSTSRSISGSTALITCRTSPCVFSSYVSAPPSLQREW